MLNNIENSLIKFKGAFVAVNLESVFKDPAIWTNPEDFQPDRHLNEDRKLIVKKDSISPFGLGKYKYCNLVFLNNCYSMFSLFLGKRMCLGEPLARITTFLFISALAKTFEFKPIPNQPPPSLEPDVGIVAGPKPFKAVALARVR